MKTKKGEKDKLRLAILDKTLMYLKENGNSGAGTSSMMKKAGLTTGALYSHFRSKDDLFSQAVCYELEKLVTMLTEFLRTKKEKSLKFMIEAFFQEENFIAVGDGCVYTALGADMHRSKAQYRALYEERTLKVYKIYAEAIKLQFPTLSQKECYDKAMILISGFTGAMSMARTMKNLKTAYSVLSTERDFLIEHFVAKENQ